MVEVGKKINIRVDCNVMYCEYILRVVDNDGLLNVVFNFDDFCDYKSIIIKEEVGNFKLYKVLRELVSISFLIDIFIGFVKKNRWFIWWFIKQYLCMFKYQFYCFIEIIFLLFIVFINYGFYFDVFIEIFFNMFRLLLCKRKCSCFVFLLMVYWFVIFIYKYFCVICK